MTNKISLNLLDQNYLNLKAEQERLKDRLSQVNRKVEAYEIVIGECTVPEDEELTSEDRICLERAMVDIAEEHGFFDTYEHKEILVRDGVVGGDARQVSQKIYQSLDMSEKFEPSGKKGRWDLTEIPF